MEPVHERVELAPRHHTGRHALPRVRHGIVHVIMHSPRAIDPPRHQRPREPGVRRALQRQLVVLSGPDAGAQRAHAVERVGSGVVRMTAGVQSGGGDRERVAARPVDGRDALLDFGVEVRGREGGRALRHQSEL